MRRLLIAAVVRVPGVVLAFELALRTLRDQIESALGLRGEVARIEAGLRAVVLHDVRIRAVREGRPLESGALDGERRSRAGDPRHENRYRAARRRYDHLPALSDPGGRDRRQARHARSGPARR